MKSIKLLESEKYLIKVKFSKRIIFIDILFSLVMFSLAARQERESIIAFISMLIFIPIFIKTIFDFYRIFFHQVYITNQRVIYIKGYLLKRIKVYHLSSIIGVYFKSAPIDFKKNMTTFKINMNDKQSFLLKNITEGKKIAELLSIHLKRKNKQNKSKRLKK